MNDKTSHSSSNLLIHKPQLAVICERGLGVERSAHSAWTLCRHPLGADFSLQSITRQSWGSIQRSSCFLGSKPRFLTEKPVSVREAPKPSFPTAFHLQGPPSAVLLQGSRLFTYLILPEVGSLGLNRLPQPCSILTLRWASSGTGYTVFIIPPIHRNMTPNCPRILILPCHLAVNIGTKGKESAGPVLSVRRPCLASPTFFAAQIIASSFNWGCISLANIMGITTNPMLSFCVSLPVPCHWCAGMHHMSWALLIP